MFGPPKKERVDPEPTVALAAISVVAGLVFSLLKSKHPVGSAICGAVGALSMLLTKVRFEDEIAKQGQGLLQINYEMGYSLSLLLLLAVTAWNCYLAWDPRKLAASDLGRIANKNSYSSNLRDSAPSAPIAVSPPVTGSELDRRDDAVVSKTARRFCSRCGARIEAGTSYCGNCGEPLHAAVAEH